MQYISEPQDIRGEEFFKVGRATHSVIALVSFNNCFSDRLCRVTEAEIDSTEVRKFDSVDQLIDTLPAWRDRVRLIVLDESAAGRLDTNLAKWIRTQSDAGFACAYNDPDKSRSLISSSLYPWPVSSFFPLNLNFDSWISMLKLCLSGHSYVTPDLLASVSIVRDLPGAQPTGDDARAKDTQPSPAMLDRLTPREMEVLKLVANGHPNKVIAAKLGLSQNTVKLHLHHIISKLGVNNRTEAAMIYATSKS